VTPMLRTVLLYGAVLFGGVAVYRALQVNELVRAGWPTWCARLAVDLAEPGEFPVPAPFNRVFT
jgi:hypothetical protein